MPDVLDRLDHLVPSETEIRVDPAWTAVQRRSSRAVRRRRAAAVVGAAAAVVLALVGVRTIDGDDTADVATVPPGVSTLPAGFTTLPDLPIEPRVNPAIAEMDDGDLFVWGGYTPGPVGLMLHDGAVYDAATETWTELPSAPKGAMNEARAVWTGEVVVVMPSYGPSPYRPITWDPASGTWATGAEGNPGCDNKRMAWTGDELVLGCFEQEGGAEDPRPLHAYDPTSDAWRALPPTPVTLYQRSVVWTGDELVVTGVEEVFPSDAGASYAYRYDDTTETWLELASPPFDATATAAASTPGGVVLVADHGGTARLDLERDAWQVVGSAAFLPSECLEPEVVSLGDAVIASRCASTFVLGSDGRWAALPDDQRLGVGMAAGPQAVYAADDAGQIVAFVP